MRTRQLHVILATVIAAGSLACSDATGPARMAAPRAALRNGTGNSLVSVDVLERRVALTSSVTASALIGNSGGVIDLPAAGLRVFVPTGAIKRKTTLTVTAAPGSLISYEFGPHGTVFNVPLRIEQDLRVTNAYWNTQLLPRLEAAYFADIAQVDSTTQTAEVDEMIPVSVDQVGWKLRFYVQHFSGYLVASGRQ